MINDECKGFKVTVFDADNIHDEGLGFVNIERAEAGKRAEFLSKSYDLEKGDGASIEISFREYDLTNGIGEAKIKYRTVLDEIDRHPCFWLT